MSANTQLTIVEQQQETIDNLKKQLQDKDKQIATLVNSKYGINRKMRQELNTTINRNTQKIHKFLQRKIAFSDPTKTKLPNNEEVKFWTTQNGEKLLIMQKHLNMDSSSSDLLEELQSSASTLVKAILCIFSVIHWCFAIWIYFICECFGVCGLDNMPGPRGLYTMWYWFVPMITIGITMIIICIVLIIISIISSSIMYCIIGVICIIIGIMSIIVGIYVINHHKKWYHLNKKNIMPCHTIKIDYSKNEILVQNTQIIYGFFTRKVETKIYKTIPISYHNRNFFRIESYTVSDGSGMHTYYHGLYAGSDKQQVFSLERDGVSKQTCQTYGNTLIGMIDENDLINDK